jgi:dipeptide/tripeptide permease
MSNELTMKNKEDSTLKLDKMEGGGIQTKQGKEAQYMSGDAAKPYLFTDDVGNDYKYFENPMWTAAIFILVLEGLERFSYYTIQPEFPRFLTSPYFGDMSQSAASSMISVSSALSYVWPLVGGAVGDGLIGSYNGILLFSTVYLVALALFCVMGSTSLYSPWMVPVFFYGLLPLGMGGVKSLIAVMGANQFHPVLHKKEQSSFFLRFYMTINLFAFASTGVNAYVNSVGEELWKPFLFPAIAFFSGIVIFIAASSRYIKRAPLGSVTIEVVKVAGKGLTTCPPGLESQRISQGGNVQDSFVDDTWKMGSLIPFLFISLSFFNVAYHYLSSYMVYQGMEMDPTWGVETNVLNSAINPLCIIGFGAALDCCILPALRAKNMEPNAMNKMIIGCGCALVGMLWQVVLEHFIKASWSTDRSQVISIFAQIPCYALIGLGEILVNPSAYDLAYKIAPQSMKGLANGLSVFMVGAVPNFILGALASTTASWQVDANGCESRTDVHCNSGLTDPVTGEPIWDYTTTNMQKLYWVGSAFALTGMILIHFVGKRIFNKLLPDEEEEATSTSTSFESTSSPEDATQTGIAGNVAL